MDPDSDEIDSGPDVIAETLVSLITRSYILLEDGTQQVVAVKAAPASRKFTQEPHDIVKELRLLSTLSHSNIITVLGHEYIQESYIQRLWMPYIPYSLAQLLACPTFSPRAEAGAPSLRFTTTAKSIMYQVLAATEYLHDPARHIAHRDIKPSNILLAEDGAVKLVDFGIAFKADEPISEKRGDVWSETEEHMYFEVGSGPYRAPELLFGPTTYDAMATDLWSLGTTFAEFFTTLHCRSSGSEHYDDDDDGSDFDADDPTKPYVVDPVRGEWDQSGVWERYSLFDSTRGDIGLAWSIFKTRGSPTPQNWPTFTKLPDANKVNFIDAPVVDLRTLLPHLPEEHRQPPPVETSSHFPPEGQAPSPLDLIHRLLVYPPASRLRAASALEHPWFAADPPVQIPASVLIHTNSHISALPVDRPLSPWLPRNDSEVEDLKSLLTSQ
ncbi:kinase-like protein [Artomyces pyxidatus]|uniref:Kinase-like protein n=1 Tax=Artomyces pyxidatus TaxID=48021 RepID=A0ACB8TDN3_9AGAM|nr:kinase-like protein [Artomyces pyxidatus]